MTELYEENRKNFLDLCETIWDLDDDSMEYIRNRTSDAWEPALEYKNLIDALKDKAVYEDQRIVLDIDMNEPAIQSLFIENDKSYKLFKRYFDSIIDTIRREYNCTIGYDNFISNKVVFKKNITKIKKVFELAYKEFPHVYEDSFAENYTAENCSRRIVKLFEEIGASKKSGKKLKFVISFNPMDWLLSSTGEDWSSCFRLDNPNGGYQYCMGLPFLCGDNNRALLYITDDSKKEHFGIKAHHYQTRTWCLINETGSFNVIKWYPNDTIGVDPINSITGYNNFKSREYFTHSKYPIDVISTKKGAVIGVYSDMGRMTEENGKLWWVGNSKDGQQIFTKNLIDLYGKDHHSFIMRQMDFRGLGVSTSGYNINDWKRLGLHLDLNFTALTCNSCKSNNKGGFVLKKNNTFLCYDCYKNNIFTCKKCGSENFLKEGTEKHTVIDEHNNEIILCQDCWDNRQNNICECCGKYSLNLSTSKEGKRICGNCLSKHIDNHCSCSECGDITNNAKIIYNSFTKNTIVVCNDCLNSQNYKNSISTFGRYYNLSVKKYVRRLPVE